MVAIALCRVAAAVMGGEAARLARLASPAAQRPGFLRDSVVAVPLGAEQVPPAPPHPMRAQQQGVGVGESLLPKPILPTTAVSASVPLAVVEGQGEK